MWKTLLRLCEGLKWVHVSGDTTCIAGLDPDSTVLGDYVILFVKFSDRLCQSKATQNHLIRTASPILML
jgi:hypothetical protein